MKIIAFTGMPFSGKSEAVKITEKMNLPIIRMGDIVWDEVKKRNLELTDKNVGFIANEMRLIKGKDIWAIKTIEKIKIRDKSDIIIIDGVRSLEEINCFKKKLGDDFILIAIKSYDFLRYKRGLNRKREDDCCNTEKIIERDKREKNWGIESVIYSANFVVDNNGTLDSFHDEIESIIKKIIISDIGNIKEFGGSNV